VLGKKTCLKSRLQWPAKGSWHKKTQNNGKRQKLFQQSFGGGTSEPNALLEEKRGKEKEIRKIAKKKVQGEWNGDPEEGVNNTARSGQSIFLKKRGKVTKRREEMKTKREEKKERLRLSGAPTVNIGRDISGRKKGGMKLGGRKSKRGAGRKGRAGYSNRFRGIKNQLPRRARQRRKGKEKTLIGTITRKIGQNGE